MDTEKLISPDRKQPPPPNSIKDFPEYKLSEGFNFNPNKEDYIPKPPKANTNRVKEKLAQAMMQKIPKGGSSKVEHGEIPQDDDSSEQDIDIDEVKNKYKLNNEQNDKNKLATIESKESLPNTLGRRRSRRTSDSLSNKPRKSSFGDDSKLAQLNQNKNSSLANRQMIQEMENLNWTSTDQKKSIHKRLQELDATTIRNQEEVHLNPPERSNSVRSRKPYEQNHLNRVDKSEPKPNSKDRLPIINISPIAFDRGRSRSRSKVSELSQEMKQQSAQIYTLDRRIKVIGQAKSKNANQDFESSPITTPQPRIGVQRASLRTSLRQKSSNIQFFPESSNLSGIQPSEAHRPNPTSTALYLHPSASSNPTNPSRAAPTGHERKQIRQAISLSLQQNFNIINNSTNEKIEREEKEEIGEIGGIVKFTDDGKMQDFEGFGKFDRRIIRKRTFANIVTSPTLKEEVSSSIRVKDAKQPTLEEIRQEELRQEELRRKRRVEDTTRKEPSMVEIVQNTIASGVDSGLAQRLPKKIPENTPIYLPAGDNQAREKFQPGMIDENQIRMRKVAGERFNVVVYLVINGPDGIGWRNYTYDLHMEATLVIDLKMLVEQDLGYEYQHQHYYFNLKEISDETDLTHLGFQCDIWVRECIALVMLPSGESNMLIGDGNKRGKYLPVAVTELYPETGNFAKTTAEFLSSNTIKSLLYPPNRDWNEEFYVNYTQAQAILLEIETKDNEMLSKKLLGPKLADALSRLAIHTRGLQTTISEFEETALKCIELIDKWEIKPQEINFLYGVGGNKYVMGGLLIRECTSMYSLHQKIENYDAISDLIQHKIEMLNYVRKKANGFFVPLTTAIEYLGRHYVIHATLPIDLNSVVYGSITQNLLVVTDLNDFQPLEDLAKSLNLNFHYVFERGTKLYKPVCGTSNWEIHKVKDKYWIVDIDRLLPIDQFEDLETHSIESIPASLLTSFIPMTIVQSSVSKDIDQDYVFVRSRDTVRCSECGEYISDIEFYCHEKSAYFTTATASSTQNLPPNSSMKNTDLGLKGQPLAPGAIRIEDYRCCVTDYQKKSVYHSLKVSNSKLRKRNFRAVSRGEFYINNLTGKIVDEIPYVKIPINPDFVETEDEPPAEIIDQIKNDRLNLKYLSNNLRSNLIQEVASEFQKFEIEIGTCKALTEYLEKKGLPLRYLGRLAEVCDKNFAKEIVSREMIARASVKMIIGSFEYLRKVSGDMKDFTLRKTVVFHLNNLFGGSGSNETGHDDISPKANTSKQAEIETKSLEWKTIIDYILHNYDCQFDLAVRDKLHLPGLLMRILELLQARLLVSIEDIDFDDPQPFKLSFITINSSRMTNINICEEIISFFKQKGEFYRRLGANTDWWTPTGDEILAALFFHSQADRLARYVYGESSPRIIPFLYSMANMCEIKHQENGRPEFSEWNRSAKIPDDKNASNARYALQKIVSIYYEKVDDCLTSEIN